MKQNYRLILLLCCCHFLIQAQSKKKIDFSDFSQKGMKTKIFLTNPKPFSILGQKNESYGMYGFYQSYQELSNSDKLKRFNNSDYIKSQMKLETTSETIKIGLIHTEFETISKEAYESGKIKIENNKATRLSSDYVFNKYSNTIISPLTTRKKGLQATFILDEKLFVNSTSNEIKKISIDFDNNKGYVISEINKPIFVNYSTEGTKKLSFKIEFENGETITTKSILQVSYSNEDTARLFRRSASQITSTRNPDLAIYGVTDQSPGKCEYEVFLSPDGILDKPIFIVDGFDPSDGRNITAVYNLLTYTDAGGNTQNLGDRIRNQEGFDVVVVNFPTYINALNNTIDGGADFIERNALSLVTVIELINSQKTGSEQNVVIGPSMGGLISRYALRFMELNSLNHQTRLWISFDSPHYGANVPIGLQHLFNYFAYGYGDVDAVKPLVEGMLRSPAAKQMLVDHFDAHTTSIVGVDDPRVPTSGLPLLPTGAVNFRTNFQNRMNTMGFPANTRNISMINGSGIGAKFKDIDNNDVNPGFDLINSNINTGTVFGLNTRAQTFCEYMPNANIQEQIVNVSIQAQIFFWVTQDTFIATAKQSSNTNGVDSSPGGLFDIFALANSLGGDPILTNFLNSMRCGYFSFIPAVSAMGLNVGGNINNNQPNYYFNINLGSTDTPWDGLNTSTTNTTPFKNWYMPPTNEGHVKLTQGNVDFAWCEIVKPDFNFIVENSNATSTCSGNNVNFTFDYNNIHGCLPSPTTFTATGNPTGSIVTFTPNSISADGTVNMTVSNIPPGTYTINVIPNGFPSKAIPVTINVYPPNPNLNNAIQYSLNSNAFTTANNTTVPQGSNLELQIPSNLYNGTIEWFDPTGTSRGSDNPTILNIQDNSAEEGTWQAQVTFTNDCARMMIPSNIPFTVIVEPSLSTNQFQLLELSVYPNPAMDYITIKSPIPFNKIRTKLTDLRGRVIQEKEFKNTNSDQIQLEISMLSQGTYLLQIETDKSKITKRIIKE